MGYFVNGVWIDDPNVWTDFGDENSITVFSRQAQAPATGTLLTTLLNGLPSQQAATISFSDGLTNTGLLATTTGWRYNVGSTPPTYSNVDSTHKWDGGTAATAGGTVNYYFDPNSNWTAAEQTSFTNAFQLWSDEADISFSVTTDPDDANVTLYRYGTTDYPTTLGGTSIDPQASGAYALASNATGSPGDSTIPTTNAALISIQTTGDWSNLGSFTANGGYGVGTVVHEIGHVLGLDHTGPYNADETTEDYDAFQFSPYDSKLYSIMSYISPSSTGAPFFDEYPVTGTNWGTTTSPFTPMIDDILAIQQLYGAPTSGDLTETQTFGFNTTITDATKSFFDFNIDTNPVVTLYDTAANNVLDLSGWSTPETVSLVPGTFSSANGMVNNIGIAYGTNFTRFIGGSGANTIVANSMADVIDGGSSDDSTVVFADSSADYQLSRTGGTVTVSENGITDTLTDVKTLKFANTSIDVSSIACFVTGTRIATPDGDVAVERLRVGDLVMTTSDGPQPIRWIGRRAIDCARHPRRAAILPIRVHAGAFGPALPTRDLLLSPDHAVFIDDVLIPVKYLLSDGRIEQIDATRVVYWHVELPRHAVIMAEGMPVESYLDSGDRRAFENGGDAVTLHPIFGALSWENACAPLVIRGPVVEAVRARLRRGTRPAKLRRKAKHLARGIS